MDTDALSLHEVLKNRLVTSVYQPIVDLESGRVVGYEALARGPAGTALEAPLALFEAARQEGLTSELEWACREAAVMGAIEQRFGLGVTLFVNVEPTSLTAPVPEEIAHVVGIASTQLRGVVEITERAIAHQPAELLAALARIRDLGWGIAVDDVGADPQSLALMPFLRPDIVKLDLRLVRGRPDREIATTVTAVNAHAERTGALVLAEGIETEQHRQTALAMGATLGQGWLFGRPGPLTGGGMLQAMQEEQRVPFLEPVQVPDAATPWDIVKGMGRTRTGDKRLLSALARRLEDNALTTSEKPVVLSAFQEESFFTPGVRARYIDLAESLPLVAALGVGMTPAPGGQVRGAAIAPQDSLHGVWAVSVIAPHFAGALVGRDLGDSGPDQDRRFEFVLTYRREVVVQTGQILLQRIAPLSV